MYQMVLSIHLEYILRNKYECTELPELNHRLMTAVQSVHGQGETVIKVNIWCILIRIT